MKIYTLKRTQILPIDIQQAWDFLSDARNLARITPPYMGFKILYFSGQESLYAGQIIRYQVQGIPGVPMQWVTEITHVNPPYYFVDEQRFGPYAFWHHQHMLKVVDQGVEMTDEVNYALPLGFLGRLAHIIFVKRALTNIFEYRFKKLNEIFPPKQVLNL
jgi:ligand-binding SRPBCC domain-containing protein